MGQSKQKALCAHCPTEGPTRDRAAKAGWYRLPGSLPTWLCPDCKAVELARLAAKEASRRVERAADRAIKEFERSLMVQSSKDEMLALLTGVALFGSGARAARRSRR